MTSADLDEGVRLTIGVAHSLKRVLGRSPKPAEIRWRTATELQRRWTTMDRRSACEMVDQFMEVIATYNESATTT